MAAEEPQYAALLPEFRSDEERAAFESFKQRAAGVTQDNAVLIRFIRARKLDEEAALAQLQEAYKWREETKADSALEQPAPKAELMTKLIPHVFAGEDKAGRPLYMERTGQVDVPRLLNLMSEEEQLQNHVAGYEHQLKRCRENSVRHGRLISDCCSIMDLNGMNMAARKGLEALQKISKMDERVYPETMGRLYIINAPWVFNVLWKVIRRWMDDNTRSKIFILGHDYKERLLEEIPAEHLPVEYGGQSETVVPAAFAAADMSVEEYDPELTEEVVAAGKTFEREVRVDDPEGGSVSWFFRTVKKDIKFSVTWFPDQPEQHGDQTLSEVPVEPAAKFDSQNVRVEGMFLAHGPGRVRLVWDNSGSWMSAKTVRYNVSELDLGRGEEHGATAPADQAE